MARPTSRRDEKHSEYIAAALRYPRLTRAEEHDLAVRAREGDGAARERLVLHGLPIVVAIARRYSLGSVRLDDVIQEGNVGLLRAIEKFDPDAGTRFATYAVWWIRAYIGKYLQEARSVVRPRLGTVATADASLDAVFDDEEETPFLDRLADEGPGAEHTLLSAEAGHEVRTTLERFRKRLGPLGWDIIQSRIQSEDPLSLEAVGKRWGLSRERVRQVELRTKRLLASLLGERSAA